MTQWSRREVIKRFFLGAAFSNVIGRTWSSPIVIALKDAASSTNGFLHVKLSEFPELATPRGSVRIATSSIDPETKRQVGLFPPIIINRGDADEFYAMSAACAHEDCIVARLDKDSNRMVCPCHGSQYDADGTVVEGPAQQSLRRFNFSRIGDLLSIEMPDVFYEMAVEKALGGSRLRISFISFANIVYEIYFRDALGSAPQPVSFSTDPAAPLDKTEIEGADDYAVIFVEKPGRFGFFEIAMKTTSV